SRGLKELSRSKPYESLPESFQETTKAVIESLEDEKLRLDQALVRILETAVVIPLECAIMKGAIELQKTRSLSPQDSIVYAAVLAHLRAVPGQSKCFLNKNSKDFANPEVIGELDGLSCKLLTKFGQGLGYISSLL